MSDAAVATALRSDGRLVVIEAPAGCGKTHQAAEYASDVAVTHPSDRLLILTHTHAACTVFSERTKSLGSRVEIRTLDSVIAQVAGAYHRGLGLPSDISSWVRQTKDGHAAVALKVINLLHHHPMIAQAIAHRYHMIICDEHQDSSGDQHAFIMALLNNGAKVRILADPMQKIFKEKPLTGSHPPLDWQTLIEQSNDFQQLDTPHRWSSGCPQLGRWTLSAREILRTGGSIDLRNGLPTSLTVVQAENQSQRNLEYQLSSGDRKPIDKFEKAQDSLLILTHHNAATRSLRSAFNRRILLWEGHTRAGLEKLVSSIDKSRGNSAALAKSVIEFMDDVGKGFSPSAFGNDLIKEALQGCTSKRKGKPATIQELARLIVEEPDHKGVAKMLRRLSALKDEDPAFSDIKLDCHREFWDAISLGEFESLGEAMAEITSRRTHSRPKPPEKAISTIHKAKGLECESVILLPCDALTFPDTPDSRCLLYVALSRAKRNLMIVVSKENPSPLFRI